MISAYCGSGEVTRYDISADLKNVEARKIWHSKGSGEDSFIADIDNDGRPEYLTCDCYREGEARMLIFEFDAQGELTTPPRTVLEGYGGTRAFNCSLETGDLDNDGKNDLVVIWKKSMEDKSGTILAYRVTESGAEPVYTLANEDRRLDLGYGEKMMCIADADNDGLNELVVTTRGERRWGGGGMAHVFLYEVVDGEVRETLLADFHPLMAESLWPAVGDADNDGENEVIIATGRGHREQAGTSHVLLLESK